LAGIAAIPGNILGDWLEGPGRALKLRNEEWPYLKRISDEYRKMPHNVDLVVLSNISKQWGPDVEVVVRLPGKDPHTLPFGHKKIFAERRVGVLSSRLLLIHVVLVASPGAVSSQHFDRGPAHQIGRNIR
jgi:hypothetical protein